MDRKALSLPILTSLVVGNMIGTGIYLLPASLAQYGTISLFSWLFASIGTLFLALTFIELNRRFPRTGGPYAFCRESFGNLIGFVIAFIYWLSQLVVAAGLAVSTLGYLGFLWPDFNANNHQSFSPMGALIAELAMVWLFTLVNIIGIHAAGVVQLVLTIIKIIPLILISIVGIFFIHTDNLMQFNLTSGGTVSTMLTAATITFWAFIGFETATIPAENTQGVRDIYKATIFGTLLSALIYIFSSFVLMGMINAVQLQKSQFPFADAGIILFGHPAAYLIALCAIISGLGTLNVTILVQGQIIFAAARDNLFPERFARLSKHDAPVRGQIFSSILITLFLMMTSSKTILQQFDNIALIASLFTLITYFVTTLAEFKFIFIQRLNLATILLRKSFWITVLAAIYTIWMISSFTKMVLIFGLIALFIAILLFFLLDYKKKGLND